MSIHLHSFYNRTLGRSAGHICRGPVILFHGMQYALTGLRDFARDICKRVPGPRKITPCRALYTLHLTEFRDFVW